MSNLSWANNSSYFYPTTITTSGTGFTDGFYCAPIQQLPSVLDSPSAPLSDRDWLDAQIDEVCELAAAA